MADYATIAEVKGFARQGEALDDASWQTLVTGASRLFDNLTEVDTDFYADPKNPQIFTGDGTDQLQIDQLKLPPTIRSVSIEGGAYPVPPYEINGLMKLFADDFDDNAIDPTLWVPSNSVDVTVAEQNEQLEFHVGGVWSGTGANGAYLTSAKAFSFRGHEAEIAVISQTIGASSGGGFSIGDVANGFNSASIAFEGVPNPTLYFSRRNGSYTDNDQLIKAFAAGEVTKWKIRHNAADNTWSFFTFSAGVWTLQFTSLPANWQPLNMRISLTAYTYFGSAVNTHLFLDDLLTDVPIADPAGTLVLKTTDGTVWAAGVKVFIDADWQPKFDAVPADVNYAVIEMCIHFWRKSDPSFASISQAENSILLAKLPPTAQATVDKYRATYSNRCLFA